MSDNALKHGAKWLKRTGLRLTKQRISLANLLIEDGKGRHVTAEELHELSLKSGDSVSLATVYNTLRAFCDVGLVNEVVADGSKVYFDTRVDDHPHFYCGDSGDLIDAPEDQLEITRLPTPPEGTVIDRVNVTIHLRQKPKNYG